MTIIAGLCVREKGEKTHRVFIGADSLGSNGWTSRPSSSSKIWKKAGFIFGISGSYRVGQAIRYQFYPPSHENHISTDDYMYDIWLRALTQTMRTNGAMTVDKENFSMDASLLVGYRGRLFTLQADFSMIEQADGLHAIGAGYEVCLGALLALDGKKPRARLVQAMTIVGQVQPGAVGAPYYVEELDGS